MKKNSPAFSSIVALSLALIVLIVIARFFTNKSTRALTNGNFEAVQIFKINYHIQQLVNPSFDLENKLYNYRALSNPNRQASVNDPLTMLGCNAGILTSEENLPSSVAISSIITTQAGLSEKILLAVKSANLPQAKILTDSLRFHNLGVKVYGNRIKLQEALKNNLQQTLNENSKQAAELSMFNRRVPAVLSVIAIPFFATIIIRRQYLQLKLIEELRAAELATLKSKNAEDEFLANMSHELRTPLNAFIGFSNLLNQTELSSQQNKYVDTIKFSGYNLLNIVKDTLDLPKMEAVKLSIAHRPFNLNSLFLIIEKLFSESIKNKTLYYKSHIDPKIPPNAIGDPDCLQQIIINLINNAIKFTQQAGIEVNAHTIWPKDEQKYFKLNISVKDTGIDIPQDKVDTIFEPFEQLEQGAQRQHGGTGLGLTIVKKLAEKTGGTVSVKSTVHKGSEFRFSCILEKAGATVIAINRETMQKVDFYGYELLVVEDNKANQTLLKHTSIKDIILDCIDNKANQTLLKHTLSKQQANYTMVSNGVEAIKLLETKSFDLVFMDIQMPEMDGYTAIRLIRNKLLLKTPVIAMTAYVSEGEIEKCRITGFSDYIAKPLDEILLLHKASLFLNNLCNQPPLCK